MFEEKFISGSKLLQKWNLETSQLEERIIWGRYEPGKSIQEKAEKGHIRLKIIGGANWTLRPYHPKTLKPILIAKGHAWPNGKPSPPEYVNQIEEIFPYLSDCLFLIKDVDLIEKAEPALCRKSIDRPNVRKAVALEAAKWVQKNCPNLTKKEAVAEINKHLYTEYGYAGYSEKHLMRLINDLGFLSGKPGRKPKK